MEQEQAFSCYEVATDRSAPNVAIVVLDSLRYDVARATPTPNIQRLALSPSSPLSFVPWRKCYAQATYTLPATVSMLTAGFLPDNRGLQDPIYNRSILGAFRCKSPLQGGGAVGALYSLPAAPSIVKGFEAAGYSTMGIGGVGWFNTNTLPGLLWFNYFQEFIWRPAFCEDNPAAFEEQISFLQGSPPQEPYFFFVNVASTHRPYRAGGEPARKDLQGEALQYVDRLLPSLFAALPHKARPLHVFLLADHGEAFGEEQDLWGHGFYHASVRDVPFVHFLIERGEDEKA